MRRVNITVWVTPEEHEKIKRMANALGLSIASFLRYLALKEIEFELGGRKDGD